MDTTQVVVIGAGLTGLACARQLQEEGREVVVVEAAGQVGGRVATEEVEGFLVDRGFQVLNPAYPTLRRIVDVDALEVQPFPRAVRVRREDGIAELVDPSRRPTELPADLRTGLVTPRAAGLAAFFPRSVLRDEPRRRAFDRAGFGGPLRHEVLDPFLAGVVCEDDGSTSSRFTAWLLAMFALGTPGLPRRGMRALPEQLADGLDIHLGTPVESLEGTTVHTPGGDLTARTVVVAAGPTATARLTGRDTAAVHGTRTFWFATDEAPTDSAAVHVDGRRRGPVTTTAVVSHTVPTYAPQGSHLVTALTLSDAHAATEAEVRAHLGEIYGCPTDGWQLLRRHDLPETVPALRAGARQWRTYQRSGDVWLAGDQFRNASIEGALQSGCDVAEAIRERD